MVISSCGVPNEKYQQLQDDKMKVEQELNDIKFGLPNLLSDAKTFYNANDFIHAREKLNIIIQRYPTKVESIEAQGLLDNINEEEMWIHANDIISVERYISKYTNGKHITTAKNKLLELTAQKEQDDYEYALSQNSSSIWKSFILNYPTRKDISKIEELVIRAEVDEIMGSDGTGSLPPVNSRSYEYSTYSNIEISNNTGCLLTVRYSGSDVKMVEIPQGKSLNVKLISGEYKIAATACGSNYAGVENLQGSYSSNYYISSSRF